MSQNSVPWTLEASQKVCFYWGHLFAYYCSKSRKFFSCYMSLPLYTQGSHHHSKIYTNNLCASIWRIFTNIRLMDSWTISAWSFPKSKNLISPQICSKSPSVTGNLPVCSWIFISICFTYSKAIFFNVEKETIYIVLERLFFYHALWSF